MIVAGNPFTSGDMDRSLGHKDFSAAKIEPRMKTIATVSMHDKGAASSDGLCHGQSVKQREQGIVLSA
jgi:hypothetical protein